MTAFSTRGGCRLPLVGPVPGQGRAGRESRPAHRLMSSTGYSSRVALQHCPLRFTGCRHSAMNESCRSTDFQRTANCVLTICLTSGGKRTRSSRSKPRASARGLHQRSAVEIGLWISVSTNKPSRTERIVCGRVVVRPISPEPALSHRPWASARRDPAQTADTYNGRR